jgi:hypothetical protein
VFEVRSTVATYRAQRMVLSIGTRGKPRTLQVAGENLPKVYSLLEDPDEWRGRSVPVHRGGARRRGPAVPGLDRYPPLRRRGRIIVW